MNNRFYLANILFALGFLSMLGTFVLDSRELGTISIMLIVSSVVIAYSSSIVKGSY